VNNLDTTIDDFVGRRNSAKLLFTAGPASLLAENITGLRPCFGRGDADYTEVEEDVLTRLRALSGHRQIVRMQGSASLALEIMVLNFLFGRILIVWTGHYSDRLRWLANSCQRRGGRVIEVAYRAYDDLDSVEGRFDWVLACSVETSRGFAIPIRQLAGIAQRLDARLMLDATASIGLESDHHLAEVIAYSSCKGLFGLTGASFIAFNERPEQGVDSFYLDLASHVEKRMTGPYHAIASLADVLPRHAEFREAVVTNKARFMREMRHYLTVPGANQPMLCTHVSCDIGAADPRAVLYRPRSDLAGSVICHLGEAHLGRAAEGRIIEALRAGADEGGAA
jgi:aspartate aminotransferase-like enzyme